MVIVQGTIFYISDLIFWKGLNILANVNKKFRIKILTNCRGPNVRAMSIIKEGNKIHCRSRLSTLEPICQCRM